MLIAKLVGNDQPLKANLKQTNIEIGREKQTKTINPLTEKQEIVSDTGYELEKVIINPVTSEIDENIVARNIRLGVSILGVSGDLQPDKPDQVKSVVPTKERQEVVADAGFELAKTIVEPIPDSFIEPSGTFDIADNGTYDVKQYANVAVNVKANLTSKEITSNGTYNASDDGVDGYSSVKVNIGGESENKLAKVISGERVELTASDLEGATSIRSYAFYQYGNLRNIYMPNSITSIGNNAFQQCSSLTSVTIGSGVTSIGNYAFYQCSGLTSILIPNNVESIGTHSFYNCTRLTNATIGDGVTSIGVQAFRFCSSIKQVIFKGQVPNIQSNVFAGCSSVSLYDFRNCTTVPTLESATALGHKTNCQIVIPDALYDTWTTASVWSTLTDVVWVKASEYVEA